MRAHWWLCCSNRFVGQVPDDGKSLQVVDGKGLVVVDDVGPMVLDVPMVVDS
mgnify:FL=1